ncbi:MAG: hypothetical protein WC341_14895, partial [Bacteroidales bacterium]
DRILPYLFFLLITVVIPDVIKAPESGGISVYLWAFFYSESWWSYFPVVPWLAYVLAGTVFKLLDEDLKRIYHQFKWPIFTASGIILAFSFRYGFNISSHLEQYYHHGTLFFGFTINFLVFWVIAIHQVTLHFNNLATAYIEWLGKNVTSVYVFQWLIIGNIATVVYKTQTLFQLVGWLLMVLIISSLASYFWHRLGRKPFKPNYLADK